MKKYFCALWIGLLFLGHRPIYSQVLETRQKVDTLSFAERWSIKTNMIDWTLLLPNIGVEYDLRNVNWSRWSVGLSVKGNWQSNHTFSRGTVYNLFDIKFQVRNYWRTKSKEVNNQIVEPRRPLYVWYRGLYASYSSYSLLLFGNKGKQGDAISVGVTYGFVKPLYEFRNRNTLDFEVGASAGLCLTKYDEYVHDRESDCYPVIGTKTWTFVPFPVIHDVHVGFVYRFGQYPLSSRYRYRQDADQEYEAGLREAQQRRMTEETNKKQDEQTMESIRSYYNRKYQELFNKYSGEKLK